MYNLILSKPEAKLLISVTAVGIAAVVGNEEAATRAATAVALTPLETHKGLSKSLQTLMGEVEG